MSRLDDGGKKPLEERKNAAINLVQALYRLAKACQLYNDANQTVQQAVDLAVAAVASFCSLHDAEVVRIVFSTDIVLVNRRMLRVSREVFSFALHLGAMLSPFGLNELAVERSVPAGAVLRFFRALVDAQRSPALADLLRAESSPIHAKQSPGVDAEIDHDLNESPLSRVIKNYAASVLVLQGFYAQLRGGDLRSAREVKRVAQKIVVTGEVQPEILVACAVAPLHDADVARRALSSAVLALAMARTLTEDPAALSTLALAALLADVGPPEAPPALVPSQALFALSEIGHYYSAAIRRNVIAFEALSLQNPSGPLPDGSPPMPLSSILFVARTFNAHRVPLPGQRPPGVDEVVRRLEQVCSKPADFPFVRMLIGALGFYPIDTIITLDTGELARVISVPRMALDFARPRVQLLTDRARTPLEEPIVIDLARQPQGSPARAIRGLGNL